ncbi:MAG: hypothetical protein HFE43_03055 [Oscillospiraceae bacterium]|jgi:hypothetical protein|nr:hypothetical protein [Oscillospiraceae bacterium]
MSADLEQLKAILPDDLKRYEEDELRLSFALQAAAAMLNQRRGYHGAGYEPRFRINVLQGALWWLGKQGAEGYASTGENGVSVSWQEVPDWLASVPPLLGRAQRC